MAKSRDGRFRVASNDEREQTLNQLLTVRLTILVAVINFYFILSFLLGLDLNFQ